MSTPIYDALYQFMKTKPHKFFMPGHKGEFYEEYKDLSAFFPFDLTELPQTDNLYCPETFFKEAELKMSRTFGAFDTCLLVNGATAGILAMFLGSFHENDTVLIDRNCHKSVISAIILAGLNPVFILPEISEDFSIPMRIHPDDIEKAIRQNPQIKGVFLTSPNYFGVCQDIYEISKITKKYNLPLLVDEAHGAHFIFDKRFPKPAIKVGADICVQSMHKTLKAPNQTALLHFSQDSPRNQSIKNALELIQTTSPSFPFLALMDIARNELDKNAKIRYDALFEELDTFYIECGKLKNLRVLDTLLMDKSRITVNFNRISTDGMNAQKILAEKFHILPEMFDTDNLVFISTPDNTKEDFKALFDALIYLDETFPPSVHKGKTMTGMLQNPLKMRPKDAYFAPKRKVKLADAVGCIAAQHIVSFPPCVPVITYGETVTSEAADFISKNNIQDFIYVV